MRQKNSSGSAYIFVVIVMLTLFLLITAALGVTATSRRISGYYIAYSGLYDLALAGAERTLFLFEYEMISHRDDKKYEVQARLLANIDDYIIYRGGEFFLNDYALQLIAEEKEDLLSAFLAYSFGSGDYGYYFSYSLGLVTGTYMVRTYIDDWAIDSRAYKIVDGRPGFTTRVIGRIEWSYLTDEIKVHPAQYYWRYAPIEDSYEYMEPDLSLWPFGYILITEIEFNMPDFILQLVGIQHEEN